jgi:hypothetical protein
MRSHKKRKSFLLASLLNLALPIMIFGCICEMPPPPCYAYGRIDTVFVGQVSNVSEDRSEYSPKVEVLVEENFKGMNSKLAITRNEPHSCAFRFQKGDRYLFYGYLDDNNPFQFSTYSCTRTTKFRDDLDDWEFLRNVKESRPMHWIWISASNGYDTPFKGLRAKIISGDNKLEGVSDEDGNIKFEVPKNGKYRVRIWVPKGKQFSFILRQNKEIRDEQRLLYKGAGGKVGSTLHMDFEVDVQDNRCAWIDFPVLKEF